MERTAENALAQALLERFKKEWQGVEKAILDLECALAVIREQYGHQVVEEALKRRDPRLLGLLQDSGNLPSKEEKVPEVSRPREEATKQPKSRARKAKLTFRGLKPLVVETIAAFEKDFTAADVVRTLEKKGFVAAASSVTSILNKYIDGIEVAGKKKKRKGQRGAPLNLYRKSGEPLKLNHYTRQVRTKSPLKK